VNVHNDEHHEPVQLFDEVVFIQQTWQSATPSYNLLKIGAFTLITTSTSFQTNHHINVHLIPTNLEMERFHLFNRLEQLRHVN